MVLIILLSINFLSLAVIFYALYTYQYFTMVCVRPKSSREEKEETASIPKGYDMLHMEGKQGKLKGYYSHGNSGKLVILVHGWRDDAKSRLEDAAFYQKLGHSVFLPDLRGHGASGGKYLGMGIADGEDLAAWVNYFKNESGESREIILDGISTGAAAVLHMKADCINKNVSGIIADSCYENLPQILVKMIPVRPEFLAGFYLYGINFWCRGFCKFDMKNSNTLISIRNIQIPVLLIGGALDKIVPVETQHKLKAAGGSRCTLWVQENTSHGKASYVDRAAYEDKLRTFLELS